MPGPGDDRAREALEIGVVAGAHGVRGGLRVRLHGLDAALPEPGEPIWLVPPGAAPRAVTVRRCAPAPGKPLLRLFVAEVTGRDQAQALRGASVRVPRAALPPLADDEFYLADALGLPVRGTVGGQARDDLGVVTGVVAGPQDLLVVRTRDDVEWYLPAAAGYVREVDDALHVALPEGMGPESGAPVTGARRRGGGRS